MTLEVTDHAVTHERINDAPRSNGAAGYPHSDWLPAGTEMLDLEFTPTTAPAVNVWWTFPSSIQRQACLRSRSTLDRFDRILEPAGQLAMLLVPVAEGEHTALVQRLQGWCEQGRTEGPIRSVLLTLQGAQIVWAPGRVAVLAPPERLQSVARSVVEASFLEHEMRELETAVDAGWNQLQADSPLAFEFTERAEPRRADLSSRFQEVLALRGRYARLTSHIIVPHVHPPTLASQIGERFRERTQMEERLDLLDDKLEVFERTYQMCSERVSDFMNASRGHRLEWAIIVLLLIQVSLLIVDMLSSLGRSTTS
jgi:hypothetical protein